MSILPIYEDLGRAVDGLTFASPVTHVYNPLAYAARPHARYIEAFAAGPKEAIFLGMNPGPWGMVQTGVPFGEVALVRDWMGIEEAVGHPVKEHPKRPVTGFSCTRSEVSGRRLWGWAADRFGAAENFFRRFAVLNYCPLVFMEESGRNRTPDKLRAEERKVLFSLCNAALGRVVAELSPRWVIGVGGFAETRAAEALRGRDVRIGRITHPSPANPRANRGWEPLVEQELAAMGIALTDRGTTTERTA